MGFKKTAFPLSERRINLSFFDHFKFQIRGSYKNICLYL